MISNIIFIPFYVTSLDVVFYWTGLTVPDHQTRIIVVQEGPVGLSSSQPQTKIFILL